MELQPLLEFKPISLTTAALVKFHAPASEEEQFDFDEEELDFGDESADDLVLFEEDFDDEEEEEEEALDDDQIPAVSLLSVVVPARVTIGQQEYAVTRIEDRAFACCDSLVSVSLPEGLEEIGAEAFFYTQIEELTLPATVRKIGPGAFTGIEPMQHVWVHPNNPWFSDGGGKALVYRPKHVLVNLCQGADDIPADVRLILPGCLVCGQLPHLHLPEGLGQLFDETFHGVSVQSLTIPASLTDIHPDALSGLADVQEVFVSADNPRYTDGGGHMVYDTQTNQLLLVGARATSLPPVKVIRDMLCANAHFQRLELPEGVETIEGYAFNGCEQLEQITLPASLRLVEELAFVGCDALRQITCLAPEPPQWTCRFGADRAMFGRCVLTVPEASAQAYRQTQPWSTFKQIVVIPSIP